MSGNFYRENCSIARREFICTQNSRHCSKNNYSQKLPVAHCNENHLLLLLTQTQMQLLRRHHCHSHFSLSLYVGATPLRQQSVQKPHTKQQQQLTNNKNHSKSKRQRTVNLFVGSQQSLKCCNIVASNICKCSMHKFVASRNVAVFRNSAGVR